MATLLFLLLHTHLRVLESCYDTYFFLLLLALEVPAYWNAWRLWLGRR